MTIYEYLGITPKQYTFKRDYIKNPLQKNVVRKGGGLEYEQPNLEDVKYLYITLNKTAREMNKIFGYKISDKLGKWCNKREYMRTPRLSKDEMIELYCNQHKTLRELADMYGFVGSTPIQDWLKFYGIEQKSPRYLDNKMDRNILYQLYIVENKSAEYIAKEFQSTKCSILKLLKKYDIIKEDENIQLSIFVSKHNDLQNRLLLNRDEMEKYIIENDIKSKKELAQMIGISYCSLGTYLRKFGLKKYFSKRYNTDESRWLDYIGLPNDDKHRQVYIDKYIVDGFDSETNTVYEYLGDYWHGNPKIFKSNEYNKTNGQTFGELYEKTMKRIESLKTMGYNVVYVWESDINPRASYNI